MGKPLPKLVVLEIDGRWNTRWVVVACLAVFASAIVGAIAGVFISDFLLRVLA